MSKTLRRSSLPLALLLVACGGGGGGSKPGPSIRITSPADGATFTTGDRKITVTGTGASFDSVEVRLNGVAIPAAAVSTTATTFTASLTLLDNANTIEAVARNAQGSSSSGVITVRYPFASFATFQSAAVVVGQADFTHGDANRGGSPGAGTLDHPFGNVLVNAGKLYLPDSRNSRVLVFDSIPAANGASADLVLGEPDFTTITGGTTASTLAFPVSVTSESGRLLVADLDNNRVLVWNRIPTASSPAADLVVGQVNLTSGAAGCTASSLNYPESIFTVGGKLLVADSVNHRVLIWNAIPTASGAPADLVLGQADFTTCTANAGGTAAATTLNSPNDVWSDGTRLVVVDNANNRVLVWSTFPTVNGAPADLVVGQKDMVSTAVATGQGGLVYPNCASSNGNQLFVADPNNNRIMVWNTFPTVSGALADVVLGQADFTHGQANDDNQDGTQDPAPSARTLSFPEGIALWGNQLFVSDYYNNRLLIYDAQ